MKHASGNLVYCVNMTQMAGLREPVKKCNFTTMQPGIINTALYPCDNLASAANSGNSGYSARPNLYGNKASSILHYGPRLSEFEASRPRYTAKVVIW